MAEPNSPASLTNSVVTIHTAPLPDDGKVLMLVEANAYVAQVITLSPQAARELVVGLLEALDVATLDEDDTDPAGRG